MNFLSIIYLFSFNLPHKYGVFNNVYDKKISYETLFNNNINLYKNNIYKTLNNVNNDCYILKNNYNEDEIISNEIDFLLNKKTKVYIHLEQLFSNTNIYHIGVTFKNIFYKVRFDIGTFERFNLNVLKKNRKTKKIFWDYSDKTLKEIINYEKNMDYNYFLGFYDCRHYVSNLTKWSCNNSSPIWKLYNYY